MGSSTGAAGLVLASASPRQLVRTTHLGLYRLMLGFLVIGVPFRSQRGGAMRWTSTADRSWIFRLPGAVRGGLGRAA